MEPVFSFLKLLKLFGLNLIKDKVGRIKRHLFLPSFTFVALPSVFVRFCWFLPILSQSVFLFFCFFWHFLLLLLLHLLLPPLPFLYLSNNSCQMIGYTFLMIKSWICLSTNLFLCSRSIHGAKLRVSTTKWCPCALSRKRSRSKSTACSWFRV